jgi:translocation and assembly module TamB
MKKILFILFSLLLGGTILFLRGPYISDLFKDILIPELESMSGQKVSIERIILNLFPLYIEGKEIRINDQHGTGILKTEKVKAYIGISEIFNRRISLRRISIHNPEVKAGENQLQEIVRHVGEYLDRESRKALKVKVKVIEVVRADVQIRNEATSRVIALQELIGEFIDGHTQKVNASVKELSLEGTGLPRISCGLNTSLLIRKDSLEVKRLVVNAFGSSLEGGGTYKKGKGGFKTDVNLIISSLKRLLHLKEPGEGRITAEGGIFFENKSSPKSKGLHLRDFSLDLKLSGDFYLQTLMEILKVKEQLKGAIAFDGTIRGPLSDISGRADVNFRNGNLFGIDIDSLRCNVLYRDGTMKFENGTASLYGGKAEAHASITLPVVDFYTVGVKVTSVASGAVLKLIRWEPDIPRGSVNGELFTSGTSFNPNGWFEYIAQHPSPDNFLDRIREIKGKYALQDEVLSLSDISLATSQTTISALGSVHLADKTLDLASKLYTSNIADLSSPYFTDIEGRGDFNGTLTGSFDDPKISGTTNLHEVTVKDYKASDVTSSFSYARSHLDITQATFISPGEEHSIEGSIGFPAAKELFDFSKPSYNLSASVKNADFAQAAQILYEDFSARGKLNADFSIKGNRVIPEISGHATVSDASVYNIPFDSASTSFRSTAEDFSLEKLAIRKGTSVLTIEGRITDKNRFSYSASSNNLLLKDLGLVHMPEDTVLSVRSSGSGTFENPSITIDANISGGTFKGRSMGDGTIHATVKNKKISLDAALFHEKVTLKGYADFTQDLPWNAELAILPGRYDFIISSILKEVPEDLQMNLQGGISMNGDRNTMNASAKIDHLSLSLFEHTFTNDSDITFSLANKKVSVKAFSVQGAETSFRLRGGLEIGKSYDLKLDGMSSLSPLKGMSKKIGYLKGDADFVVSITGDWENPDINGGMNVTNASFGLKEYAPYISSIQGHLYFDEDRVVLENLSGKLGGGNVQISGHLYLKAFRMTQFYLETALDNITMLISKDFTMNFRGQLIYKGTPASQSITGDMHINRAKYKQMVEWKSWLLSAKTKEVPRGEASVFEKTGVNIRISGSENISVDNNIARAPVRIRGEMILKGSVYNPVLLGRVESNDGYIYFRNNEFRIVYASADFVDPNRIKPVINMTAETEVQGYNIRLNLEGQIEQFSLALTSDPFLEEVDILALLTVGQVGKQLKGLEGGIGAGEATSFLTGKAQDVIEERLRTITGIDRFQVEPYVSQSTGTVEPRVTVSERIIGNKFFVTYTSSLASTEEQALKLEYLLNRNVSLIGLTDEQGTVGGDIKFRFEFK